MLDMAFSVMTTGTAFGNDFAITEHGSGLAAEAEVQS